MPLVLWMSFLLLATATRMVTSEFNPEICSIIKDSYGPIPPPLPTDFDFRADHVDYIEKKAIYQEMYMDYVNSKGKYMYLSRGIEYHFLFDYEVQQVVTWDVFHPGVNIKDDPLSHECTATDLEDSPHRFIFGYLDDSALRPKMYNSNQALRFGGKYQYAFNGTERMSERGILVDKFIGCLYDMEMDATMQMDYFFTNKAVLTSGGTIENEVTGVDNGILSVPVQANYFGSSSDGRFNEQKVFNHTENILWFKGEPEFEYSTFQIPPYMYCEDYRGRYDMPEFPTAFTTRLLKTNIARDTLGKLAATEETSFEEVMYYKEKNLARRDFTPDPDLDTEIYSKFLNYAPVKTIYDFNTGIVYITNKPTGVCYIRPIILGDFFETSRKSMFIQMGTPEEVFHLQTDEMEFKGTDFARDIECDVWVGKYYDEVYNATFVKETYITTNGWHEEADEYLEYGVPIKHTIINQELSDEMAEGVSTFNFLKFIIAPPPLYDFDVSNCIDAIEHKDFAIMLTISPETKKTIYDYKMNFLETAQYYIDDYAQTFTPLRVQRMELRHVSLSDPRTLLQFTLVGKPKLMTMTPVGQPGASLEETIVYLQKFIDTNSFAIKFYPPGSKEPVLVPALRGSLYIKTAGGDLQAPPPIREQKKTNNHPVNNDVRPMILFDDTFDGEEKEKKGMTAGHLALLAFSMLFIGIGIGIAIMYLYIRRMSESKVEDRITLTPHASASEEPVPSTSRDAEAAFNSAQ